MCAGAVLYLINIIVYFHYKKCLLEEPRFFFFYFGCSKLSSHDLIFDRLIEAVNSLHQWCVAILRHVNGIARPLFLSKKCYNFTYIWFFAKKKKIVLIDVWRHFFIFHFIVVHFAIKLRSTWMLFYFYCILRAVLGYKISN